MSEKGNNEDQTQRAMENTAEWFHPEAGQESEREIQVVADSGSGPRGVPSGIEPLDVRIGGLDTGGVYLFAGPPGPEKLVAVLQFLYKGLASGERCMLLAGNHAKGVLEVARAWGCSMDEFWRNGRLEIVGFRDDFEMRVLRSTDPEDVLEELTRLAPPGIHRIAVDPGSMFLQGGARTVLGRAFVDWARNHPAVVCATLSVDHAASLPSTTEWLLHVTHGVFQFDRRPDGFLQVRVNRAVPGSERDEEAVTLQLQAGVGLTAPAALPTRRRSDRPAGAPDRLLLVDLAGLTTSEIERWAKSSFDTDVVSDPLGAVAKLQAGATYGGVLIHASRERVREAMGACRALRPMTGAALMVASDEHVRSTDRVDLLQAGADDCLSGVLDFRELGARIRQAVAAGGKAAPPLEVVEDEPGKLLGGPVTSETFARELAKRASNPETAIFSVVRIKAGNRDSASLPEALATAVRDEDGDLVACGAHECWVLLQGARREPAGAFLARVEEDLSGAPGVVSGPGTEVFVNPEDWDRIRSVIGEADPTRGKAPETRGSGGSGGQEV
jgi:KaiC/GvpD/RAD55 family RecA-like ATPase/DNA-binding response OmpR family regulator